MDYGKFLLEKRKEKGISRYRLWKLSGVRDSTIKFWEEGKIEPTVRNYDKVLKALEVSIMIGKQ